jgi:DNA polymerase III epsilon subunit family exonuclease
VDEFVILDFETTGLSPAYARIIEVGAIIVKGSKVVDKLSHLMDPGSAIPYFITDITGITNQMVRGQPTPEQVMPKLKKFIGERTIVSHNALFDQKFLISEMDNIGAEIDNNFLCTLKLARRLIPSARDYKLTTLASHLKLSFPKEHKAHRALNDVMMTLQIWLHMEKYLTETIRAKPDFELLSKLCSQPKSKILNYLKNYHSAL